MSTNTDKVYILLKDLPGAKAGDEFEPSTFGMPVTSDNKFPYGVWPVFYSKVGTFNCMVPASYVEQKEWFELKQPVEYKRIEVIDFMQTVGFGINDLWYKFRVSNKSIPTEKYEAVKKAIERELNGETWLQQHERIAADKLSNSANYFDSPPIDTKFKDEFPQYIVPPTLERQESKEEEPKPLFVTEDGVWIKEGDEYFAVLEPEWGWEICKIVADALGIKNDRPNLKYFSTKEAAEEYILMNKPCLSVNDIKYWLEKYFDYPNGINVNEVKKLAKSKINKQ